MNAQISDTIKAAIRATDNNQPQAATLLMRLAQRMIDARRPTAAPRRPGNQPGTTAGGGLQAADSGPTATNQQGTDGAAGKARRRAPQKLNHYSD